MKMSKRLRRSVVSGVFFAFVFGLVHVDFSAMRLWIKNIRVQAADTDTLWIEQDTVWTKNDTLVFESPVIVDSGVTLRIEPGATVHLNGGDLTIWGSILAEGTQGEPIVFTSESTTPFSIVFQGETDATESLLRYAEVRGGGFYELLPESRCTMTMAPRLFQVAAAAEPCFRGFSALFYDGGKLRIEHSQFIGNHYADIYAYLNVEDSSPLEFLRVQNSQFGSNTEGTAVITDVSCSVTELPKTTCAERMDVRDNWWGNASGPSYTAPQNVPFEASNAGDGQIVDGDVVLFRPWLSSPGGLASECVEECFSNVLFLPGIKASRLYKEGAFGTEDKLWLPNYFGNDLEELALNAEGKSVNEVYAKDVMDEAVLPGSAGVNLYKSFLGKLESLKTEGKINDYQAFAYDWRQNVEDIAQEGTLYPEGVVRSLAADAESLAQSSKNGKIIVVAHSNGGLLAKALMMELASRGQGAIAEKMVLVGSPQMGTPLAILSLLYGYDESLLAGTLISRADARSLAENMPGVYGLLPSETYLDRVNDPLAIFSSERTRYKNFKQAYGEGIGTFGELASFLSGENDGREKPAKNEVEWENVLGKHFIQQAEEMHRRLDGWMPPESMEVIQIAGWGLDTVSGVEYTEKEKTSCLFASGVKWSCKGTGEYEPVYEPKFTVDGDEVVVAPSALMLTEAENSKRYWVDLYRYNDVNLFNGEHKNLMEVSSVEDFIVNTINNSYKENALPEFIKTSRPSDYNEAKPRLRMSLYSPLDIHLYDAAGRHTGPKTVVIDGQNQVIFEENIPNSYYRQFGERKYVGFPEGEGIQVNMDGLAEGSYTLTLEEIKPTDEGEEHVSRTTFKDFPVTGETLVSVKISENGLQEPVVLASDLDGNGENDLIVPSIPGGTVTADSTPPKSSVRAEGVMGKNDWYTSDVRVSLSASDGEGSGVEKIFYSLDEGLSWREYTEPVGFSEEGSGSFSYFSRDKQGNQEEVRVLPVKIDKTAPEASIGFDALGQRLDIKGKDTLSPVVSKSISDRNRHVTILTDEAGHETTLVLALKREREGRIEGKLESIAYDGTETIFRETGFQYAWRVERRNGNYTRLASRIKSRAGDIETRYVPRKDVTLVMRKAEDVDDEDDHSEDRPVREVMPGIKIPALQTDRGSVTIQVE